MIALCAYLQAEAIPRDGPLWAATATVHGRSSALDDGRASLPLDNDPGPLERLARETADLTGMVIVGLIFVGTIALGQTLHWLRHRRRVRP